LFDILYKRVVATQQSQMHHRIINQIYMPALVVEVIACVKSKEVAHNK
jgi:hypothetical protein